MTMTHEEIVRHWRQVKRKDAKGACRKPVRPE